MRIVLTHKQLVTSGKTGAKYVIFKGVGESGDTVELFFSEAQAKEYNIPDEAIDVDGVKNLFANAPKIIDANFNQRGRVDSIEVE